MTVVGGSDGVGISGAYRVSTSVRPIASCLTPPWPCLNTAIRIRYGSLDPNRTQLPIALVRPLIGGL